MTTNSYKPEISIKVFDKDFTLHRAASLEELWDNMSNQTCANVHEFEDERLPYWTELWPSSIALAQWLKLKEQKIKQKICLDVGCGLGLTALVGHMLGAKILAFDYEIEALYFAKKNTLANSHHFNSPCNTYQNSPLWFAMDWRKPAIKKHSVEFIWGADIMYERKFAYTIMDFLDYALAKDGKAWIAEPGRSVYEHFSAELIRRKWQAKKVYATIIEPIYAQPVPVTVQVWEVTR